MTTLIPKFQQTGTGASNRPINEKLAETVSVKDFGAVGDGVTNDTTAFTNAQTASNYVFIPRDMNCKVDAGLNYWQFFGEGKAFEPNRQWTINPYPQTGDMSKTYNPTTFGTYETAVGQSITINSGQAQAKTNTQVLGTDAQGLAQVYTDRDHVAQYISASSFTPIILTSPSYTATTVTDGSINTTTVLPGMIIDTQHATPYTAIVKSVSSNTATVDAWWPPTGASGTPANGTGAIVNPNTKIFGQNIVVSVSGNGTTTGAIKMSGIEMDLFTPSSATPYTNTWGFDMSVSSGSYIDIGYQVRGKRNISYYSNNAGGAGLYGFKSDGDARGLSISDATVTPIEVLLASVPVFNVGTTGTTRMGQVFVRGDGATQCTTAFVNAGAAYTSTYGGLYYVTGFNVSGGTEAKFLLAVNNTGVGSVYASDATGLGIGFQVSGQQLQIKTTSGTFQFYVFSMFV